MRIGISGITGRVGQELCARIDAIKDLELSIGLARQNQDGLYCEITSDCDDFVRASDLVIDFSLPDNLDNLLTASLKHGTPIVSGTTGLSEEQFDRLAEASKAIAILHAGNMSLGVNVLCGLVKNAAAKLGLDYDIEVLETHHKHKRDAPSGTALMLGAAAAQGREQNHDDVAVYGRRNSDELRKEGEIGYAALRGGGVIGAHDVAFLGESESLTLSHHALDRGLFADGAIYAARWLKDKPAGRLYTMADALELG